MRTRAGAVLATCLSLSLFLAACGGGTPTGAADPATSADAGTSADPAAGIASGLPSDFTFGDLSTTFEDVTLVDGAATVDRATVKTGLQAIEPTETGAILKFAAGTDAVRGLEPGQVVAFETVGIARIDAVEESGGQLVVTTTGATLDEFVQDGVIAWDANVRFDQLPAEAYATAAIADGYEFVASASNLPPAGATLAAADVDLVYKGKIRDFDVEWKLTPSAEKIDYELEISRSNVAVTAKGFVTSFHQGSRFEYDAGEATLIESEVTGMKGEAEITWAATQVKDPRDSIVEKLKLPLSVPFPIQVGPVPMTLTFKAEVRIVPAFEHTENGSSGGSFKLSYDSDHGFSAVQEGNISPVSRVKGFLADLGSKETVTAGLGPTGFAVGLEFPRLELALGHPATGGLFKTYAFLTLDQYANGMFTPGTTLTADIPPCQRADIKVSAIAGYNFDVLGMVQVEDKTDLWTQTTEKFLNDKPCTLTGE
jgi:hypothetical protein